MKNKRGITLIALVITIIVLLILAGISLSLVLGENGILTKAKDSKIIHNIAEAKETVEVEAATYVGEYYEKKASGLTDNALDDYVATQMLNHDGEKYGEYALAVEGKNVNLTLNEANTVTGIIVENGSIMWTNDNSDAIGDSQSDGKMNKQFLIFEIIEEPQIANATVGKVKVTGIKLESIFEDVIEESNLMKHLENKPTVIDSDTEAEVNEYYETLSRLRQEFEEEYSDTAKTRMGIIEIPEKIKLNSSGEIDENGKEYEIVEVDRLIPEEAYYSEDYEVSDYIGILAKANVENIILPNTLVTVGDNAFNGFRGLKSVNIPNSVATIGAYSFRNCYNLESINIPNSVNSIGSFAFNYCSKLSDITIPDSVTSLGTYAFSSCYGFKNITIPNSMTTIPQGLFSNCGNLTTVNLPSSIQSIGNSAFIECRKLKNINIQSGLTSIGEKAFKNCESIESIILPEGLTSIGSECFASCYGITTFQNHSSISTIPYKCFSGCIALEEIDFGGISSIGSYAFEYCRGLKYLNIPEGVTNIQTRSFSNCYIETYIFPKSLTNFGDRCFSSSTHVSHVIKYRGTEEEWENNHFYHTGKYDYTLADLTDQLESITYNYTGD